MSLEPGFLMPSGPLSRLWYPPTRLVSWTLRVMQGIYETGSSTHARTTVCNHKNRRSGATLRPSFRLMGK